MKKLITIICILTLASSLLSACGNTKENNSPTTSVTEEETYIQDTQEQTETQPETVAETCTENIRNLDDMVCAKPVIYLYPTEETQITVKLKKPHKLTCTYPNYENGWDVTAYPNGKLKDNKTGRELYCLYWEGNAENSCDTDEGFVVKGSDSIAFLEEKLSILGLSETEAEEFIIYWLPILQENEYNFIRFASLEEINKEMPIEFSVDPDTLIRVLMQYKPLDSYIEVTQQKLTPATRNGFTAVEWGGCKIK